MQIVHDFLDKLGLVLQKKGAGFWDSDAEFMAAYTNAVRSPMDKKAHRMYTLYQFAHAAKFLPGDVAEVGVYKGDSVKLLAGILPKKKIHIFDTFDGFPDGYIGPRNSTFSDTSLEEVQRYLSDFPNIEYYKGVFPETAKNVRGSFSLVYLDPDLAAPVKAGLEFFYPKMVSGGAILIDDYHSKLWPEVTTVVDTFCTTRGIHPIVTARSQFLLLKAS